MSSNHEINSASSLDLTRHHIAQSINEDEQLLERALVRLSGNILGIVLGVLGGLLMFLATNWLVIKGGPVVGPHLGLLGQYFVGYSVSFVGSFVGMAYGFVAGYVSGVFIAWTYNGVIALTTRQDD